MTSATGASALDKTSSTNAIEDAELSEVVDRYAPLVKRIAHHLLLRMPASVQIDDLIQSGMIGLLEAASKYYKIHKIDNGHPEARWRGYLACELVAFDVLSRDLTSRDVDERALRKEVRAALVQGQKAIEGDGDLAVAYDVVLDLMRKLPDNTELSQMARRLQSAAAEFVRSDEGKKLQKSLAKDIERGFEAIDAGDLDAARSSFEEVVDADSKRQTPQYYRAQEGLRLVEVRQHLGG